MNMKLNLTAVVLTILCACSESFVLQAEEQHQPTASSNLVADSFTMEKRGRLSLIADLRSLARMLEAHQKRYVESKSPYDSIRKKLYLYGKRSTLPEKQVLEDDSSEAPEYSPLDSSTTSEKLPIRFNKRQRLSVNGALSSLADMLAANGRQRMMSEMALNRQRLYGLGK
jgi:hypothetical protein